MKLYKIVILIIILALLAGGVYAVYRKAAAYADRSVMQQDTDPEGTADSSKTTDQTGDPAQTDSEQPAQTGSEGDMTSETTGQETSETDTQPPEPIVPPTPELRFMAMGDIMLGRGVGARLRKAGGYEKAFEKVSSYLNLGDIVFANLETPLTASNHGLDKERKIVLKAEPESVVALTSAGINLISLSNNHILDYYEKGLFDTMEILDQNGIKHAGAGKNIEEARKPAIIEKNGIKTALLAYTTFAELTYAGKPYQNFAAGPEKSGLVRDRYETIREDILKIRDQVDLVAISMHWGVEDSFKVTNEQKELAHKLIDDGADMILGHHPHQFQGIEVYKGKPIFYSMGNILFDQNDPENMEGFIIDMKYRGRELIEFTALPVRIIDKSFVEIQTGSNAAALLERQAKLCSELGTEPLTQDDKLIFKINQEGETQ
jgi:poly-gamma-glutamate capsule biosynthesis protein CapA/YwtB (metallophosphatase superfamily)